MTGRTQGYIISHCLCNRWPWNSPLPSIYTHAYIYCIFTIVSEDCWFPAVCVVVHMSDIFIHRYSLPLVYIAYPYVIHTHRTHHIFIIVQTIKVSSSIIHTTSDYRCSHAGCCCVVIHRRKRRTHWLTKEGGNRLQQRKCRTSHTQSWRKEETEGM